MLVYGSVMDAPSHVASVAQVIQAAVAPVFLLAGKAPYTLHGELAVRRGMMDRLLGLFG